MVRVARERNPLGANSVLTWGLMRLVECSAFAHSGAILEILNDAIVSSTALYDYRAREPDSMRAWFETKRAGGFPVWGAENDAGSLLGFATYGSFRAWPAYKYTVEHSVYVARGQRGHGVGTALMQRLIHSATEQQLHTLIGGIDASNQQSISFHEKLGFVHAGTVKEAGFKFERWLDLAFYQLILPTPSTPRDG
jgi:L-amino acid N-acyltransferase YncA